MPMFPPGRLQNTNIQPIDANDNSKLNCQCFNLVFGSDEEEICLVHEAAITHELPH